MQTILCPPKFVSPIEMDFPLCDPVCAPNKLTQLKSRENLFNAIKIYTLLIHAIENYNFCSLPLAYNFCSLCAIAVTYTHAVKIYWPPLLPRARRPWVPRRWPVGLVVLRLRSGPLPSGGL
jgi:hypothetical protein